MCCCFVEVGIGIFFTFIVTFIVVLSSVAGGSNLPLPLVRNGDLHQPALRFHLFDSRTTAFFRLRRRSSADFTARSSTPLTRAKVRPFEVSSSVIVNIVLLVINTLLANLEPFLWLGNRGRNRRLHADPDSFDRGVYVLPMSVQFVRASQGGFAVWFCASERLFAFGLRG